MINLTVEKSKKTKEMSLSFFSSESYLASKRKRPKPREGTLN